MSNVKQANINIKLKDLFYRWLSITSDFHSLPKQQKQVLGLFLYHHYKLKQEITNKKILWKLVFDYEVKREIKEELGMKDSVLQNILTKFRKAKVIVDGKISPAFIPDLEKDSNNFKLIFNFNIIHE